MITTIISESQHAALTALTAATAATTTSAVVEVTIVTLSETNASHGRWHNTNNAHLYAYEFLTHLETATEEKEPGAMASYFGVTPKVPSDAREEYDAPCFCGMYCEGLLVADEGRQLRKAPT
ncbi:unnamed protein product [Ceratitis capitata]|uniref:(Mediterranean fruit fly) hypothetical protein n=1 Tax=Ceratitis capitata TaxID=7213 RepID=A0A811U4K4_CERCA|nr:unnamed protein product [Ceratitis capitata]